MIKMHEHLGRPIVHIDESGFAHDMPRTHGSASTDQRCYGLCDWQAGGRTNAIGALIGKTLLTVGLFNTKVNADIFTARVKQDLLPRLPENPVIVMDNATFHKHRISSGKQGIPCSSCPPGSLTSTPSNKNEPISKPSENNSCAPLNNSSKVNHFIWDIYDELKENDFNLNIPRYVNTFEEEAEIDIESVQQAIDTLEGELAEVRGKMADLLKEVAA